MTLVFYSLNRPASLRLAFWKNPKDRCAYFFSKSAIACYCLREFQAPDNRLTLNDKDWPTKQFRPRWSITTAERLLALLSTLQDAQRYSHRKDRPVILIIQVRLFFLIVFNAYSFVFHFDLQMRYRKIGVCTFALEWFTKVMLVLHYDCAQKYYCWMRSSCALSVTSVKFFECKMLHRGINRADSKQAMTIPNPMPIEIARVFKTQIRQFRYRLSCCQSKTFRAN